MLNSSRVEEILISICDTVIPKGNGGFRTRCPVCGDSKKTTRKTRLHIDWYPRYEEWVCTCYNGGCPFRSGNLYSLYAEVKGITFSEAKKYIDQSEYDTDEIKRRLTTRPISGSVVPESNKSQTLDLDMNDVLSVDMVTDDRIHQRYINSLKTFIESRQIPNECFVAHSGRYKGRFIIPVYLNGEMVYFQGRAISDAIEPKYLNPEVDKTDIIMNSDRFDRSKYIIVTEGIIDAWMVEDNQGTSVLGGYFNDDLISKLLGMTDKGVILCFDNPLVDTSGREEIVRFMNESKYSNKVRYFLPMRKDFKDLNELRLIYNGSICDYIIKNSFSSLNIKVKLHLQI